MTEKRFERIYADVNIFCRDHNAKGISQLIEKEDYDTIVSRALIEANPAYPVPVIWDAEDIKLLLRRLQG